MIKKLLIISIILIFNSTTLYGGSVDITGVDEFGILREVKEHILNDYYKTDFKVEKLLTGAIRGMLNSLDDPYTRYMEPKPFKQMQTNQEGEFEGVGIVITVRDRMLTVVSPIDGTPAKKAGILSGDRILKIDGKETGKMTLQEAVDSIRGKKGEAVILTIWRDSFTEPKDFPVVRDIIPLSTVKYRMVDKDIGYVRLSQFVETSAENIEKAWHEFEKKGVKGIILDLRDNPGGLLQAAVDISRKFLGKAPIITVKSRNGRTMTFSSYYQAHKRIPLVVLINGGSASSSEILSGAIRDNKRGLLLGTKSFGKGVIQTVYTLSNKGGLIITTAWYFTPSGRCIHKKGIVPDYLLDQKRLTSDQLTDIYDENAHFEKIDKDVERPPLTEKEKHLKKYNVKLYDRQLIYAIDILNNVQQPSTIIYDESVYPEETKNKKAKK